MTPWLRGKRGGALGFLAIALLVLGGLAWLTPAALELEHRELATRVEAEQNSQLRLALWRLDSRVFPFLARESSRPYYHYTPTYSPPWAFQQKGMQLQQTKVLEPSPLLNDPLPEWILLHFQVTPQGAWDSPQVLAGQTEKNLRDNNTNNDLTLENATPERSETFERLKRDLKPQELFERVEQRANQLFLTFGNQFNVSNTAQLAGNRGNEFNVNADEAQPGAQPQGPPVQTVPKQSLDVQNRLSQRAQLEANYGRENKKAPEQQQAVKSPVEQVSVSQGLTAPLWIRHDGQEPLLFAARLVDVGKKRYCQGILLDWPALRESLAAEVRDLFPSAAIVPVYDDTPGHPERTMTALPLELDPGPLPTPAVEGWTPLRIGLAAAWGAALIALIAVGLGGWSLLDLSERRIRFVSAVTHELRTPLTTLRLYLDMLTGGMVKEPERQTEYLHTLNTESERLNRLISNVLDFSRLENQRPHLESAEVSVAELLQQVHTTWVDRCKDAGKELVFENQLPAEVRVVTDPRLVQQILGNFIDNACKYSRGAGDPHIHLRARPMLKAIALEIEDHGPGVSGRDRRRVFRPFQRGHDADPTAGGVGLGLALAQRWVQLLGGELTLDTPKAGQGACFRMTLPLGSRSAAV